MYSQLEQSSNFQFFSLEHYAPVLIAFVCLVIICIISYRKSMQFKKNLGLGLSLVSFGSLIIYTTYNYFFDCEGDMSQFLIRGLPLWLCNYISLACLIAFSNMNSTAFAYTFFMGLSGNLIATITPELHVGFPHPEYIIFFLMHCINLIIPIYIVIVFNYKPSKKDFISYVLITNLIMLFSHGLNNMLGSNYNYTIHTPSTSSMLDNFGEWPYYILIAELLGIVFAFLIYVIMNKFMEQKDS